MPKLKAVLACEKVIFDQDGPASVISIFQKMNIQLTGVQLPDNAVSPTMWTIFALWESEEGEVGQTFTQVLKVTAPDGSVFMEHEGNFVNNSTEDSQIKIKTQIPGLPIWKEGWVTVSAWLKGDDSPLGDFKFEIKYLPPPIPAPAS